MKLWTMGRPVQLSLGLPCKIATFCRRLTVRASFHLPFNFTNSADCVMQHSLKSPEFGTGFYMFYGDNLHSHWNRTTKSFAFYDKFYNWQDRKTLDVNYNLISEKEPGKVETGNAGTQIMAASKTKKFSGSLKKEKRKRSTLQQHCDSAVLKRPISEVESSSENIQESLNELRAEQKKKKHKKHKHKHHENEIEVADAETGKGIQRADESSVPVFDRHTKDGKRTKKLKKHKHKHKERLSKKRKKAKPTAEESTDCADGDAQTEKTEAVPVETERDKKKIKKLISKKTEKQRRKKKESKKRKVSKLRKKVSKDMLNSRSISGFPEMEEIHTKRDFDMSDEGFKPWQTSGDKTPFTGYILPEAHCSAQQSPMLRWTVDSVERKHVRFSDDNACEVIDLTTETETVENVHSYSTNSSKTIIDKGIRGSETAKDSSLPYEKEFDTATDMDIANSPSAGGIYYADELEKEWQKESESRANNTVHYAADLEAQWQQEAGVAHQSETNACEPWVTVQHHRSRRQWNNYWPGQAVWQQGAGPPSHWRNDNPYDWSGFGGSGYWGQTQYRNMHTSPNHWRQRAGNQVDAGLSSMESVNEITIDTSKPYSGSQAWLRRRQWEHVDHEKQAQDGTGRKEKMFDFTIASYNILSQDLMLDNMKLYRTCNQRHLTWKYRSQNLIHEVTELSPDILCLQEVNGRHYNEFFLPQFQKLGYSGAFKKRTGDKQDGCATFWQESKFKLEKCSPVEYLVPGIPVLDRDNVALLVLLEPRVKSKSKTKSNSSKLCVANTHLLFNPRRGDVKLAQAMLLMAEIEKMSFVAYESKRGQEKYCPTLLCGDFNCEPFCDLYKFLGRGILEYDGLLQRTMSGQEEGRYGSNRYLGKQVIPKSVGISDNCQYIKDLRVRWEKFIAQQRKEKKPSAKQNPPGEIDLTAKDAPEVSPERDNTEKHRGTTPPEQSASKSPPQNTQDVPFKEPSFKQCSGVLSHKAKFVSLYDHEVYNGKFSESEATTCHAMVNCTVDYIFYSVEKRQTRTHSGKFKYSDVKEGQLRLLGKLKLPKTAEMKKSGCLPNEAVSSDHVILMAKFALSVNSK